MQTSKHLHHKVRQNLSRENTLRFHKLSIQSHLQPSPSLRPRGSPLIDTPRPKKVIFPEDSPTLKKSYFWTPTPQKFPFPQWGYWSFPGLPNVNYKWLFHPLSYCNGWPEPSVRCLPDLHCWCIPWSADHSHDKMHRWHSHTVHKVIQQRY